MAELKIISGLVDGQNTNPTVLFGSPGSRDGFNFDVEKHSTGIYHITFRPPLNRVYGATATQVYYGGGQGGSTLDNVTIISLDDGSLMLKTGDSPGNATNRNFSFVITGE